VQLSEPRLATRMASTTKETCWICQDTRVVPNDDIRSGPTSFPSSCIVADALAFGRAPDDLTLDTLRCTRGETSILGAGSFWVVEGTLPEQTSFAARHHTLL